MTIYTGSAPSGLYADYLLDLNVRNQDVSMNTTTLNYRIYLKSKSGGYPYSGAQHKLDFTADGRTIVNTTTSYKVPAGGEFTLFSGTFTVVHNNDGNKTINFTSAFASYPGNCSVSGSMVLPKIVRGSTLLITNSSGAAITSADIGTTIRIKADTTSAGFSYKIGYTMVTDFGSTSAIISESSSINYTLPSSWIDTHFKNTAYRTITFSLYTYNGNTLISEDIKTLTIRVPSHIIPVINNVDIIDSNPNSAILGTGFYQNISEYRVTVDASGARGSTITNYKATMGNQLASSKSNVLMLSSVSTSGNIVMTVEVTDSRGRKSTTDKPINVLPFKSPAILTFTAVRQADGVSGEARLIARHTSVGSPDQNPASIIVRIKKTTEVQWVTVYSATSNVDSFNETINLGSNLDAYSAYEVEAIITDKFSTNKAVTTIPTSEITMAFNADYNSIGVGLFPNMLGRNNLEIKGDVKAHGKIFGSGTATGPKPLGRTDNLNSVIEAGFYSSFGSINRPTEGGNSATLIVTKADTTTDYKTFTDTIQVYIDNDNAIYIRNSVDKTNTWTAWVKVGDGSGPEIINHSTGYTIKYPDGIMEQVIEYNLSSTEKNFTSGSAGFYGAKTVTVNFHEPFYLAPAAVANCHSSGYINGFIGETYTNRATVRLYSPNSVSASSLTTARVTVIAKGRWK